MSNFLDSPVVNNHRDISIAIKGKIIKILFKKLFHKDRVVRSLMTLFSIKKNKAFVGLGSCDDTQTERSIFEYVKWTKLRK